MNEVTVAICAYNCEKYIEETLNCIINQTFKNFDLLILNDCSSDNSVAVIHIFQNHNFEYKILNFDENKGLAAGRYFIENNVKIN